MVIGWTPRRMRFGNSAGSTQRATPCGVLLELLLLPLLLPTFPVISCLSHLACNAVGKLLEPRRSAARFCISIRKIDPCRTTRCLRNCCQPSRSVIFPEPTRTAQDLKAKHSLLNCWTERRTCCQSITALSLNKLNNFLHSVTLDFYEHDLFKT